MKTCNVCGETLSLDHFNLSFGNTKDGYVNYCKVCKNEKQRRFRLKHNNSHTLKYEKTKKGFLVRLYRNMKSRITGVQKAKHHLYAGKDLLPKEEFYAWALSHNDFHRLFSLYEASGFDKQKAPSVDRINTELGYTIQNMRWMTYKQNSALGCLTHANQIKRRVSQYDLSGGYIATYESITEAANKSGACNSHICRVVNGELKTAKGFIWKVM